MNELTEAAFRRQVDDKKRIEQAQTTKAFGEVMAQQLQREQAQRQERKSATQKGSERAVVAKKEGETVQERIPKSAHDIARRTALSRAMQGGLEKTRTKNLAEASNAASERAVDLDVRRDDERERLEREDRADELAEVLLFDEPDLESVEPDRQPVDGESPRERDGGARQPEGRDTVDALDVTPTHARPTLPSELLEKLADRIAVAALADGRTEIHIQLKGSLLEGATLKVGIKKGKVHCTFEGCDKQTRNLIEASRGELMRALAKKGLDLDILRVR